jgi:hypothetical protein
VNRLAFRSLGAPTGTVANVESRSRLQEATHRVFTFGAIGRFLGFCYLRSVDPIALVIQKLAGMVGLRSIEHQAWEFRVYWRQLFEEKVCALAHDRTLAAVDVILSFYADMGYVLPSYPQDVLYSRLIMALGEDGQLIAEMDELQKLPIGADALRQRLLALDAGVERHMSALAHNAIVGRMSGDEERITADV